MKIALIGYGKMGKMIERLALARGHEIVSIIDIDNQQDFDSPAFASAEVAIEFTSPATAYGNIMKCFERGVKVVSGSTSWMDSHREEMERLCAEGKTLFWASNFSVGMAIFRAVNRYLAKIMGGFCQYDVRIEETHHVHKLDAPSGTAVTLAQDILPRTGQRKQSWKLGTLTEPSGSVKEPGELQPSDLRIDCIRRGEVPGIHTVEYDSAFDKISITHDAHTREGFALGAVLAAEYAGSHSGLLSIDDMFQF